MPPTDTWDSALICKGIFALKWRKTLSNPVRSDKSVHAIDIRLAMKGKELANMTKRMNTVAARPRGVSYVHPKVIHSDSSCGHLTTIAHTV